MFRNRYNIVHQRLMRNESFQASTVNSSTRLLRRSSSSLTTTTHTHRLTPIANLLGRHGSHHLLLGLLTVLPWTGGLALCDPTGTVALDLSMAQTIPADSAWFCPGMLVLVDGVYETEGDDVTAVADAAAASSGKGMAGGEGIGGVVGGRFQGFFIGQPPAEKRRVTLGVGAGMVGGSESMAGHDTATIGGGFGWIDFLGVGSERAVGRRMRALERRVLRPILPGEDTAASGNTSAAGGRGRIVFLGEVNLDQPRTLQALRRILTTYASEAEAAAAAAVASSSSQADDDVEDPTDIAHQRRAPAPGTRLSDHLPLVFVLTGSFTSHPLLARGVSSTSSSASAADGVTGAAGGGSIEYKEHFDSLASVLSEFPVLLRSCTFVFVPGDNDGWVSAFTAGAATPLPRRPVPDVFTSRVRRAFATAVASAGGKEKDGVAADGSKEGKGPGDGGQAVFTSNPARLSLFGPSHEIVLFRDDITARLRRTAIRLKSPTSTAPTSTNGTSTSDNPDPSMDVDATGGASSAADPTKPQTTTTTATTATSPIPHDLHAARKLVKTILDQGYLSPFPLRIRPVHWDLASSPLHVYPLPSAMLLADPGAPPFCVTYEGCHVVNPGTLLVAGRKDVARWVEYRVGGQGRLRECVF